MNNEYHKKYFARDSHDAMLDITGKRNSEIVAFQEGCLKAKEYGWNLNYGGIALIYSREYHIEE